MVSKRHQRQLCFYVSILVFAFFVIYYGAPLLSDLFGSSDSDLPDDTIPKSNVEDM
jgi:hypothetical protein